MITSLSYHVTSITYNFKFPRLLSAKEPYIYIYIYREREREREREKALYEYPSRLETEASSFYWAHL
jgi:hypothetical protein